MRHLVTDHRVYGSIVDGIISLEVEVGVLEYSGWKDNFVIGVIGIGIDRRSRFRRAASCG
ncbi:hypothetical protein [Spirosoma harenae]